MRYCIVLCLVPLYGAMGALLGGYRAVAPDDPVIQAILRPVLESNGMLGSLPIRRVEQQRVNPFLFSSRNLLLLQYSQSATSYSLLSDT